MVNIYTFKTTPLFLYCTEGKTGTVWETNACSCDPSLGVLNFWHIYACNASITNGTTTTTKRTSKRKQNAKVEKPRKSLGNEGLVSISKSFFKPLEKVKHGKSKRYSCESLGLLSNFGTETRRRRRKGTGFVLLGGTLRGTDIGGLLQNRWF